MITRTRDYLFGREIYEHIKVLCNPQRMEYFNNVSLEHKELKQMYKNTVKQQKYKRDEANKQKANDKAKKFNEKDETIKNT